MNLSAVAYREEIKLWKTPIYIGNMCCTNENGDIVVMRGKNAKRALYMYLSWVKNFLNGQYESDEEPEKFREVIENHISYVFGFINDKSLSEKNLMVFVS